MSERLQELQRALAAARARLGALADRLAGLRELGGERGAGPSAGTLPSPPFGGADALPIDDLELTFRAVDVDVEGNVSVGSDQDKAR